MIDVRIFSLPILFPSLLLRWALEISRAQCVHPPQYFVSLFFPPLTLLRWQFSVLSFSLPSGCILWGFALPCILYLVYIHICPSFWYCLFFFSIGYVDLGGEGYVLSLLLQPRFPNTWKTKNRLYLVVLKWIALSKFYGWWNIFWKSCVADSSPITFPGLTGIPSCYKYMSRVTPHPPKLNYVSPVADCPVSCKLWHMICYQKLWTWLLYRSWGS